VAVKTVLEVVAAFIPACQMGGSVALLGQAFVFSCPKLGVVGSGLYVANTFVASLGALGVPFCLLPMLAAR
jgi:hypothetical protein